MKRALLSIAALGALLGACMQDASISSAPPAGNYLEDAAYRRDAMVRSLVNPENGYAQKRLAHYDSGDDADWSRLPIANPIVTRVAANGAPMEAPRALDLSSPDLAIEAFFRYPVEELSDPDKVAADLGANANGASTSGLEHAGFWNDETHGLGGLVRVTYDDGLSAIAMTCSTCHARMTPSGLVVGAPNDALDLGWGPGKLDVTTSTGKEPVAISDLRPVKLLSYLHHDANVHAPDETTLAIRIETLVITSQHERWRPPREVSAALAKMVRSLADDFPALPASDSNGAAAFSSACGRCHDPSAGFSGPPVALDVVGTDPTLGLSQERGTGTYRVPSLRGVSTRGRLLHDASIGSVTELLDPARKAGGHAFGQDLDATTRAAIVAYVSAL